jgi:V8-like Glu-specific endopeptidase
MFQRCTRPFAAILATALLVPLATAQDRPLESRQVEFTHLDSGWVANDGPRADVVAAFHVISLGADWMRLSFSELALAGDPALGNASTIKISSERDGYFQLLNPVSAAQWGNTSAYFNGDTLLVELIAHPGTGLNRVKVGNATVGETLEPWSNIQKTICGTDDRVLSNDPFNARLMPVGCTAWLLDDVCGCFGTAGHCIGSANVVQFNVPLSNPNGSLNNPPPQDQYTIDNSSRQWVNGGLGNDWAYFGVFPNSTTGLRPKDAQGGSYTLADAAPPFNASDSIRITGYGTDSGTSNQVQQTNAGPWVSKSGTILRYAADTEGGNSGSPVFHEDTGEVIGVHTNGGCSFGGGSNSGTSRDNTGWGNALATPLGVCAVVCPATSITFHNGSGVNPSCLTTTQTPVIGGQWKLSLDASGVPGATHSVVRVYSATSSGTFNGAGEILVNTSSTFLAASILPTSGGIDIHTINVPNNQGLAGITMAVQGGIRIGSQVVELCNAEMVILGCSAD